MRYTSVAVLICSITLTACIAHHPVSHESKTMVPEKTSGVIREADIGEVIYEEGSYDVIKAFEMSDDIESTMPGSMGFPFGFAIRRTILKPDYQTDTYIYYAAPYEDVLASHTLLGSVIDEGDTVGIRIEKKSGKQQWYVDNSKHNHGSSSGSYQTIWHRDKRDDDRVSLKEVEVREYRSLIPFKQITYEGSHDNNLLFIYTALTAKFEKEREYRFKIKSHNQDTIVSLKGNTMRVIAVTDTGIRYSWL